MQPDDSIKKRARKVVDAGSVTLAHLQESIQTNELLQEIIGSKNNEVPEEKPDVQKISIEGISVVTLKGEDGKTPTEEELVSLIKPLIPEPIKGENYILTEKDKKDIAKKIEVPVVEKVIEKTEVIKEISKENKGAISFIIDGEKITNGVKGELEIPFNGEITGLTLVGNTVGSIDVDILKANFSSLPNYTSITGEFYPGIKEDDKKKYVDLPGWDTTIKSGDILRFSVVKSSDITRLLISINVTKYD